MGILTDERAALEEYERLFAHARPIERSKRGRPVIDGNPDFVLHGILRFLSAMAFASFTSVTPLIVAISVYREPPNGWFSP